VLTIVEREMTPQEYELMKAGFATHSLEHGNPIEASVRYGYVAIGDGDFVGCSSGLATRIGDTFNAWFYLTDLFVQKPYRRQGLGQALLQRLEAFISGVGVKNIWTWTSGYEAPAFYQKQGYTVFAEFKSWYPSGHSRMGFWKQM
jgi:GNAT superfamily N-acetyltransferase